MNNTCPYCSLAGLYGRVGDVYCSRAGTHIDQLDNALFKLPLAKGIETDGHYTRLTLRFVMSGSHLYTVDRIPKLLTADHCLLMNIGQQYKIQALDNNSLVTGVAFKPSFVSAFSYAYTHSQDFLLDNPEGTSHYAFMDGIHISQKKLRELIEHVSRFLTGSTTAKAILSQEVYIALLEELCKIDAQFIASASKLEGIKSTTRKELLRRLKIATDYMEASPGTIKDIAEVARVAALSEFHFYRSFKKLTGTSPYQFLKKRRIEFAASLLRQSHLPIQDICVAAGFDDPSSFSRLFRKLYHCSPLAYRQETY